jgi:hypothetical protein
LWLGSMCKERRRRRRSRGICRCALFLLTISFDAKN